MQLLFEIFKGEEIFSPLRLFVKTREDKNHSSQSNIAFLVTQNRTDGSA